jgi:hypothetical protein
MSANNGGLGIGAQGRNRTTDTRIFSPLLYQLSYLGPPPADSRTWYSDLRLRCAAARKRVGYSMRIPAVQPSATICRMNWILAQPGVCAPPEVSLPGPSSSSRTGIA